MLEPTIILQKLTTAQVSRGRCPSHTARAGGRRSAEAVPAGVSRDSLREPGFIASAQRFAEAIGVVRPVSLGDVGDTDFLRFFDHVPSRKALSVQSPAGAPASLSRCSRRVFKASALALSWSVAPGSLATAANARSFRRTPSSDPISPLMRIVGDLNTAAKGPRWARRASYQDDQRRGPHRFREHGAPATSPVRSRTQTGPSAGRAECWRRANCHRDRQSAANADFRCLSKDWLSFQPT